MSTCTTALLALVVALLLCLQPLRAQNTPTTPNTSRGPTLTETIAFMNRSVQPESSSVSMANACEVDVVRNHLYDIAMPKGSSIKNTDQLGVTHYNYDWAYVSEVNQLIQFDLAAIDPASITSKALPSTQFLKTHDLDKHPEEWNQVDLVFVSFGTANSTKAIKLGAFSRSGDGIHLIPAIDSQVSFHFIIFESKDRAERFVTAFKHAVDLCGGKGSDFPPTPSK